MAEHWLIIKRGLFFRPDCQGYTGIRDEAGRYSYDFAKDYDRGELSIMREADAPEFMPAAFNDLVIKHLTRQRDALVKALQKIADQKTTDDNFEEYGEDFVGDYEEGYDAVIRIARQALLAHVETVGGSGK